MDAHDLAESVRLLVRSDKCHLFDCVREPPDLDQAESEAEGEADQAERAGTS